MKLFKAFIFLLSIGLIASCSSNGDSSSSMKKYSDFEIVINNSVSLPEILNQKEEKYIVFLYSETCSSCHEMQTEIIDFAVTCTLTTYFLDTQEYNVPLANERKIGATSYTDISMMGTPTILEVENATVTKNIPGLDDCLTFLNEQRIKQN